MRRLSAEYPRFGSRRIRIFLAREGAVLSHGKCTRPWAKAALQVPKKRRRKAMNKTVRPLAPIARNSVWSYDFMHDACANGQKITGNIRSACVIQTLTRLMSIHGVPHYLRSDNGPECVSHALLDWVRKASLNLALIDPGKPWQNGTNESFNGKFRDECLSMEWFRNRMEAKVVIEDWRVHYNTIRPHSSLQYQTPLEFKQFLGCNLNNQGVVF